MEAKSPIPSEICIQNQAVWLQSQGSASSKGALVRRASLRTNLVLLMFVPLTSLVTLGILPKLGLPQFPNLKIDNNNSLFI